MRKWKIEANGCLYCMVDGKQRALICHSARNAGLTNRTSAGRFLCTVWPRSEQLGRCTETLFLDPADIDDPHGWLKSTPLKPPKGFQTQRGIL